MEYNKSSILILGRSGSGKTTIMLRRILSRMILGFKADVAPRPILLTASKVLCSAIKMSVKKAIDTLALQVKGDEKVVAYLKSVKLADITDFTTPMDPSLFPIVITFKEFLSFINDKLESPFPPLLNKSKREVDFHSFTDVYYPRFSEALRSRSQPTVVYTEIMSNIKGSLESVLNGAPLSLEQYQEFADKRHSVVDKDVRLLIYNDGYLRYEKLKEENDGSFDIEDIVGYINKQFELGKYHGERFTDVYVDEVQDLSPAQICLISRLCRSTRNGFVFAGQ